MRTEIKTPTSDAETLDENLAEPPTVIAFLTPDDRIRELFGPPTRPGAVDRWSGPLRPEDAIPATPSTACSTTSVTSPTACAGTPPRA